MKDQCGEISVQFHYQYLRLITGVGEVQVTGDHGVGEIYPALPQCSLIGYLEQQDMS